MPLQSSGNTPLVKIDALSEKFGLPNLFIKDESKNPFGTWKDRRSRLIIEAASEERIDKLCLITSGNAGYSLAKFGHSTGIKIFAVVDERLDERIKRELGEACHKVLGVDLSRKILMPEEVIALCREGEEVIWEVTNGWHSAYESIIAELEDVKPDYIVCPLGSGEGFVGLADGIIRRQLKTRLIGVSNEQLASFADKLRTPWTPYARKIESITKQGNEVIKLTEQEIRDAYEYAKDFLVCEPSSAVVLAALAKVDFDDGDRVVVVNSGKGLD